MPVSTESRAGDLSEVLSVTNRFLSSQLRAVVPGVVQSFNAGDVTCVVQPVIAGGVIDKDLLKAHQINEAKQHCYIQQANDTIELIQDSVDLEIATDADKEALLEWRKYRVLLTRVDVNQAPDVQWPEQPK
ncbi:tail fiber assembly protein [Photorhabdus heterorhabditis]|uniref:tail fiber assembly protein n=1 Tax=Photorhabdus heterorhabditis TaxID=880156 RepID=UPI0015624E47|nr:tail fiber assembly protein [Photorhabdus heterorhabditis]NRN30457.1 tail fiber assembly protein [Photorhabdus heterorhabditis subsp. aluminescens]